MGALFLVVLVVAFGPALQQVPLSTLQIVIGVLLLLFGMRWLRKAVLRGAGVVGLHDEQAIFAREAKAMGAHNEGLKTLRLDKIAFATTFKAVVLEGLEVVFIVVAVGGTSGGLHIAVAGGLLAMIVVAIIGVVVRKPLAQVPENTLKYAVGVILASIGTFWAAEGMGATWPLDLVSILGIAAIYFGASRVAVMMIHRRRPVTA